MQTANVQDPTFNGTVAAVTDRRYMSVPKETLQIWRLERKTGGVVGHCTCCMKMQSQKSGCNEKGERICRSLNQ
jgi:hypothetical protein